MAEAISTTIARQSANAGLAPTPDDMKVQPIHTSAGVGRQVGALSHPPTVRALHQVCSGPRAFRLDVRPFRFPESSRVVS
jgi:hypothetical protein